MAQVDNGDDYVGLGVRPWNIEDAVRKSMDKCAPNRWIDHREQKGRLVDERRGLLELVKKLKPEQRRLGVVVLSGLQDVGVRRRS